MSEATVHKLTTPAPERDGKVFNVEITFNLGKAAQGRILTDFPQGGGEDEFASQLQMMTRQSRRQQAVYEMLELEELIEQAEDQAETFRLDHEEAERDHQKKVAHCDAKVVEARRMRDETEQRAKQDHARSDKRGEFKAPSVTRQQIDRLEKIAQDAEAEKAKLEAERAIAQGNLQVNLRRQDKLIARLKRKIEQKRAIAEGRA